MECALYVQQNRVSTRPRHFSMCMAFPRGNPKNMFENRAPEPNSKPLTNREAYGPKRVGTWAYFCMFDTYSHDYKSSVRGLLPQTLPGQS